MINTGVGIGTNAINQLALRENMQTINLKRQQRKLAATLNVIEQDNLLTIATNLFMSRFTWECNELNVSSYYIEKNLFYNGLLCFYKHDTYGWVLLPATPLTFNIYGEPLTIMLNGYGTSFEITYSVNADNAVLIRDNPLGSIPNKIFSRYATLLADLNRTCEVYANAMKKPIYFKGNGLHDKKTQEQVFDNQNNNEFAVYLDTSYIDNKSRDLGHGPDSISEYQSDHNAEELRGLYMYKRNLFAEMLSLMGIQNLDVNKGAQLTSEEVNKNDDMCKIILYQAQECREEAVKKMNEISGLNIKCEPLYDMFPEEIVTKEPENKEND